MTDPATDAVRDHYDRTTVFYRAFWGDHVHHGYWEDGDDGRSARAAQERLVALLAERAGVGRGARVLDVGCGVGGSARWLARHLGCRVDGITLSPVQAEVGTAAAQREGLADRVRLWVHDARDLDALGTDYDAVWTVECSEHLEDKAAFVGAAARRLRPGGALALCAWLRGDGEAEDAASGADGLSAEGEALVASVCEGMLCPSLATMGEYEGWMQSAGFEGVRTWDLTPHVARTWDLCAAIARRPEVRALLSVTDAQTRAFVGAFPAMQRAYAEGAMRYGMLVGRLPGPTGP